MRRNIVDGRRGSSLGGLLPIVKYTEVEATEEEKKGPKLIEVWAEVQW